MKYFVIGLLSGMLFISGCELQAHVESKKENPGLNMKEVKVSQEIEAAVIPCQNVEVTQTKERTTQTVKFEGFQHIERGPSIGQRNVSHCIPCTKEHKTFPEKKVCEGEYDEGTTDPSKLKGITAEEIWKDQKEKHGIQ